MKTVCSIMLIPISYYMSLSIVIDTVCNKSINIMISMTVHIVLTMFVDFKNWVRGYIETT